MALGTGEGGEPNAPLARAVIGGLVMATIITLLVVPAVSRPLAYVPRRKHLLEERFRLEYEGHSLTLELIYSDPLPDPLSDEPTAPPQTKYGPP